MTFECIICMKWFSWESQLKIHLRAHRGLTWIMKHHMIIEQSPHWRTNNHVIIESTITSLKLSYKCFTFHYIKLQHFLSFRGCPHGVMVKAMDCGTVVREFILQSCYYVHFQANTLGKGMNPLILLAMG